MKGPATSTRRGHLAGWARLVALWASLGALAVGSPVQADDDQLGAPDLTFHAEPLPLPDIQFKDNRGSPVSLASFKGRLVLLNLWATWCGPCREEMPALDRLQARLGGPNFTVVPLSIDQAGPSAVRAFFLAFGIKSLPLYIDESGRSARALRAFGIPTTLLVTADGRELGRMVGAAQWDGPDAIAMIRQSLESQAAGVQEKGSEP